MAIRERLVYAIDVVTDGATRGLSNFRTAVREADTTTGKFKAGASSAMSTVQAHAGSLALAGGTALVAFGVKSVQAFTDGAIAAGKFSDASGLAVEDASRWQEVATDLGVSADAIAGGFVKLEKAIATNGPAVEDLGIKVLKTADGQADMNATMLDAIDRLGSIEDPAERAKAATELFGRGFADMAEIVLGDADDIKKRLGEVSDAQVFDADEVAKARKFRDAMDELQDVATRLSATLGEALVPALTDIADSASDIEAGFRRIPKAPWIVQKWWDTASPLAWQQHLIGVYDKVGSTITRWFGAGGDATHAIEIFEASQSRGIDGAKRMEFQQDAVNRTVSEGNPAFSLHADNLEHVAEADEQAARQAEKHADVLEEQRDVTDELREAEERRLDVVNRSLGGSLRLSQAQRDARDSLWKYNETVKEHNEAADEFKLNQDQMNDLIEETALDQIDAARATADYRIEQAEASGATVASSDANRILIEELFKLAGTLDGPVQAAVIRAIEELDQLSQPRTIPLNVHVTQSGANIANLPGSFNTGGGLRAAFGAEGAIVNRPTMALIGEAGPEALIPLNRTAGNSPLPGGMGAGGNQYTINLYGGEATPQAVVDAIKRWERLNGTAWRS
jgi:hypothetical protein